MSKSLKILALFFCTFFFILPSFLYAQDDDEKYWEGLLQEEVEVENPVYKPVLSLGTGLLHFNGDIKNPDKNPMLGEFGFKFNLSTYIGKKNFYKLNFFGMYGHLQGHDFSISRAMQSDPDLLPFDDRIFPPRIFYPNSSFRTEMFMIGANVEYGFAHLIGLTRRFRPYFSIGVSSLIFSPKGEIFFGDFTNGVNYHFWSDGTIRDLAEGHPNSWNANFLSFDKDYETDLSTRDIHSLEKRYPTTTAAFPAEVGFDFYLSYRVFLRVSATYFLTLSDFLDNYDKDVAARYNTKHNNLNDAFLYTNFSLHFDLFSDPKYMRIDKLFAELDWDEAMYEVMFADQDADGVPDRIDDCPDTPFGAEVDTLGCPFDTDGDGIPDVIDIEPNTPSGAIVNEKGAQLSPDKLAQMFEKGEAVRRDEIQVVPVVPIWTRNISFTPGQVPPKFKSVDKDGDGYISFQEMLWAIDDFFDDKSSFTLDDIYTLNNFFFSQ